MTEAYWVMVVVSTCYYLYIFADLSQEKHNAWIRNLTFPDAVASLVVFGWVFYGWLCLPG